MRQQLGSPSMNPVSRLIGGLLGLLVLVGAFFFGIFVLAIAIALGLIAWLVLWLRMWWLRRNLPRNEQRTRENGDVIEAEYEVISRDDEV
jgi:predicted lipid-binding transport protein (Tim44 family)